MDLKKTIISAINNCTDVSTLNYIYNDILKNNDILKKEYDKWVEQQADEIGNLHINALMYENLFDDMCIAKSSIMGKYLDTPQGSLKEDTYHFSIDAHYYKFIVTETTENGETDIFERTIKINPQFVDDKNIILHEMIHAHEHILSLVNPLLKETLIVELYKHLLPKFKDLDCIIYNHANISHNSDLAELGGYHGLLFMLKSLDLDFRCGNDPFTIFGYDYNHTFTELNLI
ncbi:hypothetical protein D7X25_26725 [bacterium 1XD42-8]|nr:hypothetical protein D7X25_26725 [bacterium 1XD42-8]